MEDYPKDTPRTNAFEETCGDCEKPHAYARRLAAFARGLELEAAEKQARIDALMLEYCPDEMTPEQIANWERHQKAVRECYDCRIGAACVHDKTPNPKTGNCLRSISRLTTKEHMESQKIKFCEFTGDGEHDWDYGGYKNKCPHIGITNNCLLYKKPLGEFEGWRVCCAECTEPIQVKII